MDIQKNWHIIKRHFNKSFRSNFYVSIASVNENNEPDVTPVGSLFLNHDQSGFYFEKYPVTLPKNAETNRNICVLAVNSSLWLWLKSLIRGRFNSYPGVKLYGKLGEKRLAGDREIGKLKRRMKQTKGTKGNKYLWGDMQYVRDIKFTKAEKINLGKMTLNI